MQISHGLKVTCRRKTKGKDRSICEFDERQTGETPPVRLRSSGSRLRRPEPVGRTQLPCQCSAPSIKKVGTLIAASFTTNTQNEMSTETITLQAPAEYVLT